MTKIFQQGPHTDLQVIRTSGSRDIAFTNPCNWRRMLYNPEHIHSAWGVHNYKKFTLTVDFGLTLKALIQSLKNIATKGFFRFDHKCLR